MLRFSWCVRWFCPFVQRAWIALEEGKVPYQYKEVNPYKKEVCLSVMQSNTKPSYLAINPKGLVPVRISQIPLLRTESCWWRKDTVRKFNHRRISEWSIWFGSSSQRSLRTCQGQIGYWHYWQENYPRVLPRSSVIGTWTTGSRHARLHRRSQGICGEITERRWTIL